MLKITSSFFLTLTLFSLIIINLSTYHTIKTEDVDSRFDSYFSKEIREERKRDRATKQQGNTSGSMESDLELSETEFKEAKSPLVFPKWTCGSDPVSFDAIVDDEMTNNNYHKINYRYKTYLLYVTATWCDYCCQHNAEIKKLKEKLKGKTIDGNDIPVVIAHSNKAKDALRELKLVFFKVPSLYLVKDNQFHQYNSFFRSNNILRFINNLVNPIVELNSIKEVENFFDLENNYDESNSFLDGTKIEIEPLYDYTYRNRMIAFFADAEEYSAEYSDYITHANKIAHRQDLRVGIVTDKAMIRHFKNIYEGTWFNSHSWNSIVLKRDEKTMFLDLSLMNEHLEIFTVYNTVSYVDELTSDNTFLTAKISTPVALFFIDASFIMDNYHTMLKFLEFLSKEYIGKLVVMYVDGNTKTESKQKLGLQKDMQIPNFVINYLQSNKQKHPPKSYPFCDVFLKKFIRKYVGAGSSTQLDDLREREKNIRSFDDKIVRNLKLTTKLNPNNINKILGNKKYDILVFVVDTDYDSDTEVLAKYINKLCTRLKALGIKSSLVATFDINENGNNNYYGSNKLTKGDIFLASTNSNRYSFKERVTTYRLMKFLEKNSNNKVRLPDIPHIELELHEDYYKKKALLETYDENIDKDEFEIDDIINLDFEKLPTHEDDLALKEEL